MSLRNLLERVAKMLGINSTKVETGDESSRPYVEIRMVLRKDKFTTMSGLLDIVTEDDPDPTPVAVLAMGGLIASLMQQENPPPHVARVLGLLGLDNVLAETITEEQRDALLAGYKKRVDDYRAQGGKVTDRQEARQEFGIDDMLHALLGRLGSKATLEDSPAGQDVPLAEAMKMMRAMRNEDLEEAKARAEEDKPEDQSGTR